MNSALRSRAEQLFTFLPEWCTAAVDLENQQMVQWGDEAVVRSPDDVRELLRMDHDRQISAQKIARYAHRPGNFSGDWWSSPSRMVSSSARTLPDGSPAALWFAEDRIGFDSASARDLISTGPARVFEIATPENWIELCLLYPFDVSEHKRFDWQRATGHSARWFMPNWSMVANDFEAVHLQVAGYLTCAGLAIPLDDRAETASVIAGWSPDETFWLTSDLRYGNQKRQWTLEDREDGAVWIDEAAE